MPAEMGQSPLSDGRQSTVSVQDSVWCLVLALWGTKYRAADVNVLAASVRDRAPSCKAVILVTDRFRPDIDPMIDQRLIPEFLRRPEFLTHGLIAKLAIFARECLPEAMTCVYLDLDTLVMGDLGRIAAVLADCNDYVMLPPATLMGFGRLRRALYRLSHGRRFATGNSSILVYHSAADPNLAETFIRLSRAGQGGRAIMQIDDLFISWFAQPRLRGLPDRLGVSFRREFLSRSRLALWLSKRIVRVQRRQANLVAVTFNGEGCKLDTLRSLSEGEPIAGGHGRSGVWGRDVPAALRALITGSGDPTSPEP